MKVNFQGMKTDAKIENEIEQAIAQILDFSRSNQLGLTSKEQFITNVTIYESKSSFDNLIKSSSEWKAQTKVPATRLGFGKNREFFVVSWAAYQGVHPRDSRSEYEKLMVHEIAHLLHIAYLKGDDEKMGPIWFYEGFACFVANQYPDAALPKDPSSVINLPEGASYRDYVAIFRALRKKYSVRELLHKANDKKFNDWAISTLQEPIP